MEFSQPELAFKLDHLQPVKLYLKLYRIPDPQEPKSGSFAHFGSLGSKIPGLLAKRPSKRPEKDPKNQFTGPDFENPESNRGSRVLILMIRYSSSFIACCRLASTLHACRACASQTGLLSLSRAFLTAKVVNSDVATARGERRVQFLYCQDEDQCWNVLRYRFGRTRFEVHFLAPYLVR